jgi:hypothetical protein
MTERYTPFKPYMTRSEYAAYIGRSPSYVTQLAAQGRVVFTPDGRFVDVAKTDALIAATADPAKQPVAARHAAARAARAAKANAATEDQAQPQPDSEPGTQPEDSAEDHPHGYDFQGSKAKREHYAAERERAAFLKEAGELMDCGQVVAAFAQAGTSLRTALEAWASDLPPLLAGQGEQAIGNTLVEETERLLTNVARTFQQISEGKA